MALPHPAHWFPFVPAFVLRHWSWCGWTWALPWHWCVLPPRQIKHRGPFLFWHQALLKKLKPFTERVSLSRQSRNGSCTGSIFNSNKQSKHNRRKSIPHSHLIIHHLSLECCLPVSFCLLEKGCGSVECSSSSSCGLWDWEVTTV